MKKLTLLAVVASLVAGQAFAQDSKPAAFNAPVEKHAAAQQFTCAEDINVVVRPVELHKIELSVNGEKQILDRIAKRTFRLFGLTNRATETNRYTQYVSTNTVWNQKVDHATLKTVTAEGQAIVARCEEVK
ncbi:MAG: hypothetical protein Q4D05_05750 [Acinetobacter sp.]|nr:hypothetical protein [Acinetobacter sp.]